MRYKIRKPQIQILAFFFNNFLFLHKIYDLLCQLYL